MIESKPKNGGMIELILPKKKHNEDNTVTFTVTFKRIVDEIVIPSGKNKQ